MEQLFDQLQAIVGERHVLLPEQVALRDPGWCPGSTGAGLLVRPADAHQMAAVLAACNAARAGVVPHGGLTGLVEGTASRIGQVIVSTERLDQIVEIDPVQSIAVVQSGVTLARLDAALAETGLMFGVDIAARDSCTLGGMVAANAGGIRVLRHGMTRANVLGLEVALADGSLLDLTNRLIKNNAGYDLKQVFIGAEGTLGVVTQVVLRLVPRRRAQAVALVALARAETLDTTIAHLRSALGESLTALEALWPGYYATTTGQPGFGREPLPPDYPLYLILEVEGPDEVAAQSMLEKVLAPMAEDGRIRDAVLAQSGAEAAAIWRAREDSGVIETSHRAAFSYDVGLEARDLVPFAMALERETRRQLPGVALYLFGHVADGNLHVSFGVDDGRPRARFDALLYAMLGGFAGATVSAEHGIGMEKRDPLRQSTPPDVLRAMRTLKAAFDPRGIMNPGKILYPEGS